MTNSFILALAYVVTCLWLMTLMARRRTVISVHLGTIALFSLGYYPLPVLFKPLSSLAPIPDEKVFYALLIHYLFLCALVISCLGCAKLTRAVPVMNFGALDHIALRHLYRLAWAAFGLYLAYIATTPRTSYGTENFDAFFEQKSNFRSLVSAVAVFASGFICIAYAIASAHGRRRAQFTYGAMIVLLVALALPLGQRLAAIAPIMMLFAAMAVTRQTGRALRILAAAVIFLMAVSPFAVYLREARRDKSGEFLSAPQVAGHYQVSSNPAFQSFQSIIDRSDLIFNTVFMKDYIDRTGYANWLYYYSVLVSPVPRLIFPDKPYVLSTDGAIDGEISVQAWRLAFGSLGSLTAFGGLTAYREGGWIGVILDGLALGLLFSLLARWLGEGSFLARVFYINFFLLFAVQKVPPDFFEALAGLLGHAPLILALLIVALTPIFTRLPPRGVAPAAERAS
ncbi:O-antigen polysaccharide polymerase Wzy [Rhodoblastus acidophilus]|uniref:O-antigen polysaccharide polymerase Wzy n=1 Tax=Candidatus Rhodoblastus alkanivorans TaxID=2954117 RepID=A0ABS9Z782_9HYPH|nr:O-antigen polysaccharide polymerase Wzy [Candidatus Rhodoblastus alkanivorans]MCI4679534.1 O-antigen polysaccharide polymerase Wzy [Candidatus Rhodoblastus alkanivorans]MCI4683285.1 O-antigen polysaccharide polymerase Wzy [Candidatus Rhodoblastus alkanivorans]MDI4640597.1 O-antigen polysaccharide polymerase Wzy [Rhodoblastus acidophilus]